MKLLAVGDLHLGRRPSRLPQGLDAVAFGAAEAWRRCVDQAINEGVAAVLLAGDVVDRERDFFEAYRDLESGVKKLVGAGIRVLAVVGNHDVHVLPRLADELPDFTLLGRDGCWQSAAIEAAGETVTIWGWSFPQRQVTTSPLAAPDGPGAPGFDPGPGVHLGLLHCDRDQTGSPYAPVTSVELAAARMRGWLLGHIHQPDPLTADDLSGYLGSVSAAHPGEPGARGPWLLEIERGQVRTMHHLPLAPLRYQPLAVDLSGIGDAADARTRVLAAVREMDRQWSSGQWAPQAVALRLRLTGRTRFGSAVLELFSDSDREQLFNGEVGTHYFIEHLRLATLPEADLPELAQRGDPVGVLASRLLLLDREPENPDRQALVRGALERLRSRQRERSWQGLNLPEIGAAAAVSWLRRSGVLLLDQLMAQAGEYSGGDCNREDGG